MYLAGYVSLLCCLLLSVWGGGLALLQLWEGKASASGLVRWLSWGVCGTLLFASATLLHALFWQDYSLEYVASYTDQYLPLFYRLTAFWAGQPGSLLFWATCAAICGWLWSCSKFSKDSASAGQLWFWALFYFQMAFFCLLLTCYSNPFIILKPAPADGNGLNPLLQNPGMIIHPPLLFLGYALLGIPACLALAQRLAPGAENYPWFKISRIYLLGGWILLTAGIIIGAWWAYMELGWGGYWAWDPVENASLLPWLSATALLHTLALERASGKLQRASAFLAALTLVLAFFSTWLTRSGIIESVHAFGDGGVGIPLLVFVLFFLAISSIAVFAGKTRPVALSQPLSREGLILLTSWILLALAFIILLATLWPLFSKIGNGLSRGLDPSFYNRVCLPIGALLICILAICRACGWQGGLAGKSARLRLIIVGLSFICCCALLWVLGYQKLFPLVAAGAGFAALMAAILEAFRKNSWQSPVKIAAFGGHAGIAIITLGIAFSGPYTDEYELVLKEGSSGHAGAYAATLEKIEDGSAPGYDFLKTRLAISLGDEALGILEPERRIYPKYGTMQFSEVDVISGWDKDIYVSLLGMDEEHNVLVKISIEPLVNWIWIGGLLMCAIPLFGLWTIKNAPKKTENRKASQA